MGLTDRGGAGRLTRSPRIGFILAAGWLVVFLAQVSVLGGDPSAPRIGLAAAALLLAVAQAAGAFALLRSRRR